MTTTPTDDTTPAILPPLKIMRMVCEGLDNTEKYDREQMEESIEALTGEQQREILSAVAEHSTHVHTTAGEYSEPGYTDPEHGYVFLGDWWVRSGPRGTLSESREVEVIAWAGGSVEWHDEWCVCRGCDGAIRTQADSYGWRRSYVEFEDEVRCDNCMEDEDERADYLRTLEDNPHTALTLDWDLEGPGYVKLDGDFQNGLYGGQSASPEKIAADLRSRGVSRFVFKIDSKGQFDLKFSCWVHREEITERCPVGVIHRVAGYSRDNEERLEDEDGAPVVFSSLEAYEEATEGSDGALRHLKLPEPQIVLVDLDSDGPDPAAGLKAAMQDATAKMAELPEGEGVKYASCDTSTGTATVKIVSSEDFIAGRMGRDQ